MKGQISNQSNFPQQQRTLQTKSDISTKSNKDQIKNKPNSQPQNKQLNGRAKYNKPKTPSKNMKNRLRKFNETTRWLPNSAFTTYFGKPAFENYGYGNTNPVYGGLFYGNYMLSHNMNPMDGPNHPEERQVYSSALMKCSQGPPIRRPEPPRKTPEEIRNTPEELEEIMNRKKIFQEPNNYPARDIIPPNLTKCRKFRSGRNTPVNSEDEEDQNYCENWNIDNYLSGKKNKKMKLVNKAAQEQYKLNERGKVKFNKKKMKEDINNKFDDDFYAKVNERRMKKLGLDQVTESVEVKSPEQLEFERQRDYYLAMLGEAGTKNLEDLTHMEVKQDEDTQTGNYHYNKEMLIEANEKPSMPYENEKNQEQFAVKNKSTSITGYDGYQTCTCKNSSCPVCVSSKKNFHTYNLLKAKENPALLPPNSELIKTAAETNGFVCCKHHSQIPLNCQERDPRYYQGMPPCMMDYVIPAGVPSSVVEPLNLFTFSGDLNEKL